MRRLLAIAATVMLAMTFANAIAYDGPPPTTAAPPAATSVTSKVAKEDFISTVIVEWHDSSVDPSSKKGERQAKHLECVETTAAVWKMEVLKWDIAAKPKDKSPCRLKLFQQALNDDAKGCAIMLSENGAIVMQRLSRVRGADGIEFVIRSRPQLLTEAVGWKQVDLFLEETDLVDHSEKPADRARLGSAPAGQGQSPSSTPAPPPAPTDSGQSKVAKNDAPAPAKPGVQR